jgi:DNA-binding NtrC family response regulator
MKSDSILWAASEGSLPETIWSRLKSSGYQVLVDRGNQDVLARIRSLSPRLWVGETNGDGDRTISWLGGIRAEFPELPLLLISRKPSIEQAVNAIKMGATEYVPADASPDYLWNVLEALLTFSFPKRKLSSGQTASSGYDPPIAVDPGMCRVMDLAKRIAPRRATVLLQGESGTGKEVLARYIHHEGDRCDGPFIAVNCAALPENLLESELFGHEKGAFTGAASRKKGKFELAHEGTLLLDEISEMPPSLQAKLLRVLQEREIDRIGGQFPIPIDVRVIGTTNRDLEGEVKAGTFRMDLYYRLSVVPLTLPPLRQRKEDILPLARFFLEKHGRLNGEPTKCLSKEAEEYLLLQSWPGNVRELENVMERATLLSDSEVIGPGDLGGAGGSREEGKGGSAEGIDVVPLKEMEKRMIFSALRDQDGNRTHAAKVLGISVRTLRNKLHEYKEGLETEEISTGG